MNQPHLNRIVTAALVALLPITGCTLSKDESQARIAQSNVGSGNPADQVGIAGVPGASVPVASAIAARIQLGVKNNAVATAKNFAASLNQLGGNLPQNTNPNLATGYDQVPLLAYAACTDIAPSVYNVTGTSIPAARAALIAAGVNILDQHTGGLASTGPLAASVATTFGNLVDQNATISGETVLMEFVSVCMTASTFGAQMMGF